MDLTYRGSGDGNAGEGGKVGFPIFSQVLGEDLLDERSDCQTRWGLLVCDGDGMANLRLPIGHVVGTVLHLQKHSFDLLG